MDTAHELILAGGLLGLASIIAGSLSARFGTPLLLVFLVLGMLVGEDGPVGIRFDDFQGSYLVGSLALAIILFEGGLKTTRRMLALAGWPALALATVGVGLSAGIVGAAGVWLAGMSWTEALLIGAAVAPTDAAAVAVLLRRAELALPERVLALLEVESGFNDPMSVFLIVLLVDLLITPSGISAAHAGLLFAREMGGGALIGVGGGFALLVLLRHLPVEVSLSPALALCGALVLFGGAQCLEASGFLAVYLTGVIVGTQPLAASSWVERFFEASGWLAQIVLFLLLGLLVTPHDLVPLLRPSLISAAALIFVARPIAAAACLLPFGFPARQVAFTAWMGLRGGVPIYLTIIPVLAGAKQGEALFSATFVIVLVSLVVQGWTVKPVARRLGFSGPLIK